MTKEKPMDQAIDLGRSERFKGEFSPHQTEDAGVIGRKLKVECRLDWYWNRAVIDDPQHAAGIHFRKDYLIAAAAAHVTSGYGNRITGSAEWSEAQCDARGRLKKIRSALGLKDFILLERICGLDEWASGDLPKLRIALDGLAKHYGLT